MTDSLWALDIHLFRTVHTGWGGQAGIVWRTLSDMGLGHVAIPALLLPVAFRKWPAWAAVLAGLLWLVAACLVERDFATFLACVAWIILGRRLAARTVTIGLVSGVAASLVRLAVEPAFDRVRPSNLPFAVPMEEVYGASAFPSGHSTLVAALVTGLLLAGVPSVGLRWALGAVAVLIGVSRVAVGVHFPSDVLGGFALGSSVAALVAMFWPVPQVGTETAATS